MPAIGRTSERYDEGKLLKGLVAGVIGGLVASVAMNQFQTLWSKLAEEAEQSQGKKKKKKSQEEEDGGGDATVKAAAAISEGLFDHELTKSEEKVAGPAVHYATGATLGAIYGAMGELAPFATFGAGLPFGAAVWLFGDEAAVPALGLSKPPTEFPLSTHADALAAHFVYGLTTEVVRRAVRKALVTGGHGARGTGRHL